ncbi:NAD(P)H-hydrate dehydratase [Roseivivax sp. CAU 1761]
MSAAEMRNAEAAAMASGEVSGGELMERAGQGVVAALLAHWPELGLGAHRALVLCGPGNNGGDGYVIARALHGRGWEVTVQALGDPGRLTGDAAAMRDRWRALGAIAALDGDGPPADLVVDALFGTGLARPLDRDLLRRLHRLVPANPRRVAVDMPSGVCADSGRVLGDAEARPPGADLTVTFHSAKRGHVLAEGAELAGRLAIRDIGIGAAPAAAQLLTGPVWPLAKAGRPGAHKYDHGHALVLTGGAGRTGAARLAARAALRIGAGLVTLGAPAEAEPEVAAQITALMLRRVADAGALSAALEDARLNALCLGPGLGLARAADLVPAALGAGRATVLDADALTAFAKRPERLFEHLHDACVLTPHGGEFARLFPDLADRLRAPAARGPAFSRLDAAREAAARAGCTILLKGPDTVIAAPNGALRVNAAVGPDAAPWLGTAGTGDVLAGLVAGLMARGAPAPEAAASAAWLHAEAARRFGPGLIAEDLPEALPGLLRDLGA